MGFAGSGHTGSRVLGWLTPESEWARSRSEGSAGPSPTAPDLGPCEGNGTALALSSVFGLGPWRPKPSGPPGAAEKLGTTSRMGGQPIVPGPGEPWWGNQKRGYWVPRTEPSSSVRGPGTGAAVSRAFCAVSGRGGGGGEREETRARARAPSPPLSSSPLSGRGLPRFHHRLQQHARPPVRSARRARRRAVGDGGGRRGRPAARVGAVRVLPAARARDERGKF